MKNYFKVWAVLFAFTIQSSVMYAQGTEIPLSTVNSTNTDPLLNGMPGPSRAPARRVFTLSAYLTDDGQELMFYDESESNYMYTIYDMYNQVIMEGSLDFTVNDTEYIDISTLPGGQYELSIAQPRSSKRYVGVFYLF